VNQVHPTASGMKGKGSGCVCAESGADFDGARRAMASGPHHPLLRVHGGCIRLIWKQLPALSVSGSLAERFCDVGSMADVTTPKNVQICGFEAPHNPGICRGFNRTSGEIGAGGAKTWDWVGTNGSDMWSLKGSIRPQNDHFRHVFDLFCADLDLFRRGLGAPPNELTATTSETPARALDVAPCASPPWSLGEGSQATLGVVWNDLRAQGPHGHLRPRTSP